LFGSISEDDEEIVKKLYSGYRQATHKGYQARLKREKGISDNTAQQQMYIKNFYKTAEQVGFLYDASIRQADHNVGGIIETLKSQGVWDNTLFILLSDHGEEFGEHGGWQHDQSVYEELMHVPLMIRFPHAQFAGRRVNDTLSLVDLMPMIFDYMQRPDLMYDLRGKSFLSAIDGVPFHKPGELFVTGMRMNNKKHFKLFKETRGDINIVIRKDNYKGIFNVEPDTMELYDLTADPAEKIDLSVKETDLTRQMKRYAKNWYAENSAKQKNKAPLKSEKLDEATLENLKSLGYIE
jgi:arylsulfatase A-like enzyme